MAGVQGKLIYIKVGTKEISCQTDLTLNLTANTTEQDPCKPAAGESLSAAEWVNLTVSSRQWDASVSAQTLVDNITTFNNIADLIDMFVSGTLKTEVAIQTNSTSADYDQPSTFVFTGQAIMTGLTLNATGDAVSTGDVTFNGTGAPTFTKTAVGG